MDAGFDFSSETLEPRSVQVGVSPHELESDFPAEGFLNGSMDHSHGPLPQLLFEIVFRHQVTPIPQVTLVGPDDQLPGGL